MRAFNLFLLLSASGLLGGACAPLQLMEVDFYMASQSSGQLTGISVQGGEGFERGDLQREPSRSIVDLSSNSSYDSSSFPDDNNQHVQKWLRYYTGRGRSSMERNLRLSPRYFDLMADIFEEEGLPRDLVYMAMVESGFTARIRSHANAVGYWQFIAPTARNYGLKMDSHIDERQDFVLSTRAAAQYLKNSYNLFGDWYLSMAAYNAGEARVSSAIQKTGSYNFWSLVQNKALPPETRDYVPKILAVRHIALNHEYYGFYDLNYHEPLDYDWVRVGGTSSFSYLSQELNISKEELMSLNPKFKTDIIPDEGGQTYIRVPVKSI